MKRSKGEPRGGGGETARAKSDGYADNMYFREEDFTVAERAQDIAEQRGVTSSQIALAWMLSKPHITAPIIGASKMPHLEQAIAALDIQLPEDEVSSLEEAYQPHPVLGHT